MSAKKGRDRKVARPRRQSALRFLPILVLVSVAGIQIPLAKVGVLTPWKGGGFGMFSTLDGNRFRVVRAYAVGDDWQEPIRLPQDLTSELNRVVCMPTRRRMLEFARFVAGELHARSGRTARVRAVRIDVLRSRFDPDSSIWTLDAWRSATYPLVD